MAQQCAGPNFCHHSPSPRYTGSLQDGSEVADRHNSIWLKKAFSLGWLFLLRRKIFPRAISQDFSSGSIGQNCITYPCLKPVLPNFFTSWRKQKENVFMTYRGTWVRLLVARQDSLRFQQLTLTQIFQGLKGSIVRHICNPFKTN